MPVSPSILVTWVCKNGGQMDSQGKCACVDSYVGNRCERIMADCTEGVISGTVKQKGVYNIQPALASSPFPVFCRKLEKLSRTRIFYREDPAVSFNRSWSEYRDGFGDLSGDHWLGLEKLHLLTASKSYGLRFSMKPPNSTASYSFFEDFVLSDEASGYSFTVGTFKSDKLANCLDGQQGAPFSAYDVDNDDNSTFNCALQYGGGWWFKGENCSLCSPMGPILPPFDGMRKGVLGESFWSGFGDGYPFPITMYLVVE
ncbi:fibrinogen C domain-containing protein 1-A-like [Littorina saxatilis]|uniref:fibrinogen C domain-containing protein 1-A-like n=1 Tax=Littorina saxatilis TaxID=31220 RepID=UPI0038B69C92